MSSNIHLYVRHNLNKGDMIRMIADEVDITADTNNDNITIKVMMIMIMTAVILFPLERTLALGPFGLVSRLERLFVVSC